MTPLSALASFLQGFAAFLTIVAGIEGAQRTQDENMETLWNNWHIRMWSTGVLTAAIAAGLAARWIRMELSCFQ
jgi:hypothetical protein